MNNYRKQRIDALLQQIREEIKLGVIESGIAPEIEWSSIIVGGKNGYVMSEFNLTSEQPTKE